MRQCCICWDDEKSFSEGVSCSGPGRHFYCDGCFDKMVNDQARESLADKMKRNGRILCCMDAFKEPLYIINRRPDGKEIKTKVKCRSLPFSDLVVAMHTKPGTFDVYVKSREDLSVEKDQMRRNAEYRDDVKREAEALIQLNEQQRRIREAKDHIFTRILPCVGDVRTKESLCNLCPQCGTPFQHFEACFKITCRHCKRPICAWCINICETPDPHTHVRNCRFNLENRNVFSTEVKYERSNSNRRHQQLLSFLNNQANEVAIGVVQDVKDDLKTLGFANVVARFLNNGRANGSNSGDGILNMAEEYQVALQLQERRLDNGGHAHEVWGDLHFEADGIA